MKHLSQAVKVGILALIMAVGSYAVWKTVGQTPSGSSDFRVWAKLIDASGLPVGSRVVIAGLPVGEIVDLSIDGRYARLTMALREDIVLWSNAILRKKSSSLLGDYFIEIDPGSPRSLDAEGKVTNNVRLRSGDQIVRVIEATSADELIRRIDESLPKVDSVLLSVRDLSEDVRALVNGPLASTLNRFDRLVQDEADTVANILARTDATIARIELITRDIRGVTQGADVQVGRILGNLEQASAQARELVATAQGELEQVGLKVREKLDMADGVLSRSESIAAKIDDDQGTLGRLVNDSTLADNLEEITEDAKGFLGNLFGLQTYVGLRTEYNVFAQAARHYVSIELATRPDKFYYIELMKGPRGSAPEVELEFDPAVGAYRRNVVIEDKIRFTFQFAKRLGWMTLRYGIKESTGGVGLDLHGFDNRLHLSVDAFDATFDDWPNLRLTAAYAMFQHLYILAGIDEALNAPGTLPIVAYPADVPVPVEFQEYRYGRDLFFGAMLKFNDEDLTALLTVGGAAVAGALN